MALPPVGVQLVAKDATGFDSALRTAGGVLDGFGKTASAVTATVNSAFGSMASSVGNAIQPIGRLFDHIFVSVIRSVVNDAIHQLERFGRAILDAALEGTHLQDSIERLGSSLNGVANSAFKPFTDKLGALVDEAAPAFLGIVQAAESYLGGLGVNALTWGQNFITQFASGMWAGVGEILQVLTEIANLVTYWLSPGSPPRLLPDIDKWGTSAAGEYFGGWTKGAFAWFSDLSGTLSNLIRSIPLPKGDQVGVIPQILGARQGIAAAVEELRTTGTIATSTIDAITAAVGTSDTSVRAYLESMIRLQAANATTRLAQDELNKATEKYKELLKPVDDEIAAITEEQQQLADEQKKSLLQLVLKDPGSTLAQKRQAQLEIERLDSEKRRRALLAEQKVVVEGAQDKLEAAKTAEQLAQEDFDARKALILAQTEQNNLLKEQLQLLESLNKAAGADKKPPSGGKGGGPSPFGIKPFDIGDLIPADILSKWKSFTDAISDMWGAMVKRFQPAIDVWNNKVIPALEGLVQAFEDSRDDILAAIAAIISFTVASFSVTLPTIFTNLASSIDSLTQIWTNHSNTIIGTLAIMSMAVITIITTMMTIISGIIALALNTIAGTMDLWSAIFEGDWEEVGRVIKETVQTDFDIVQTTISGALASIMLFLGPALRAIYAVFKEQFDLIKEKVDFVMPYIERTMTTIMNNIRDNVIQPVIDKITAFGQALITIWEWLQTHVFNVQLPTIPGINAPSNSANGTVNGPASTGTAGGMNISNSSTGGTYTYAPTYVGNPPPPPAGFALMQSLYG